MHYIFLISFNTTKVFKFQIYYSNFSFSQGDYHDNQNLLYKYNWYYSNNWQYSQPKNVFSGKVSDSCIRDLGFNSRLLKKLIGVLVWW